MKRTLFIWSVTESGFFVFFILLALKMDEIIKFKAIFVVIPLLAQEGLMLFVIE